MRLQLTSEQRVADRYLRAFDLVESRLESALVALERAESTMSSITASVGAMGLGGSQRDKMAESLAQMDKAVADLSEWSRVLADQFAEVEAFVSEVQRRDGEAGRVLRLVYVNGLSVRQISERGETAYSKKTIYEHWKRGLDAAFDLLSGGSE